MRSGKREGCRNLGRDVLDVGPGAEQDRAAEAAQFAQAVQERQVVFQGLAEADPRVQPDALAGDAVLGRAVGSERMTAAGCAYRALTLTGDKR